MNKLAVSNNINSFLNKMHFTNGEFAEKMNVTDVCVSRWRSGVRLPSSYAIYRMSKVFGCKMEDIMKGVDE